MFKVSTQLSELLPIDGFSYETAYGHYVARVVGMPSEILSFHERHKFEIEFRNEDAEFLPVRRLILFLSVEDVERDRAGVYRLIREWMIVDPGAENYFTYECRFDGVSAFHKVAVS
jgi:hypothetical protein